MFDVYLITEGTYPERIPGAVEGALRGLARTSGRLAVQLRVKGAPPETLRAIAGALRELTQPLGVPLIVNADLGIAHAVGADGVQLPEAGPTVEEAFARLGPQAVVGVSRHDAIGLARAAMAGATFATLSPAFPVPGKAPALGVRGFATLARTTNLPVLALGGVTPGSAAALVQAGARGVAVVRAVFGADDPAGTLARLLDEVVAARAKV